MSAPILEPNRDTIARAAGTLRDGGLVAMPTETVYGLAADAANPRAVARLYEAKGRPHFNPLIAHCAAPEAAYAEGVFSAKAKALATAIWPGPLTLIVEAPDTQVCDLARAGLSSLGLRVPAHPVAQALLEAFGGPLVAPSANPSGRISPTEAAHVSADIGEQIDLILDGGRCSAGVESTIVDARGDAPALLRPGALDPGEIGQFWPGLRRSGHDANMPSSPGQLLRHYAPNARLRLDAQAPEPGEAYLGFGPGMPGTAAANLSPDGDLSEAAANLFRMLRELDASHARIAVAPIPSHGLGEAINDRLARAAHRD